MRLTQLPILKNMRESYVATYKTGAWMTHEVVNADVTSFRATFLWPFFIFSCQSHDLRHYPFNFAPKMMMLGGSAHWLFGLASHRLILG